MSYQDAYFAICTGESIWAVSGRQIVEAWAERDDNVWHNNTPSLYKGKLTLLETHRIYINLNENSHILRNKKIAGGLFHNHTEQGIVLLHSRAWD